jgi:hypothetical protein
MGLFEYFRRRRERESALSPEQLAALDPSATDASSPADGSSPVDASSPEAMSSAEESIAGAIREANSGGRQSVPSAIHDAFHYTRAAKNAGAVQGIDYGRLQELQASVMVVMREHGIDPMSPDASKFMDPEVQRALQDAVIKHGLQDKG